MLDESNILKRRGIVRVSAPLIKEGNTAILKALYSNFYPLSIEPQNDFGDVITFIMKGLSEHFDEIEEGSVIPQYDFQFIRNEDGTISFKDCNKYA